ncbi:hypothetical protein SAMN05660293_01582 [Dyadobacter psychrophilus]|uniref:Uncharacterized protein n=1 Tax=Dyadobacter psychrophilus TaxID=651661 RepID=A0A1T5DFD9_9BACT|nr:hypothetical protein SAMN05660293_01582 [Dyadobacter psychrophilus]
MERCQTLFFKVIFWWSFVLYFPRYNMYYSFIINGLDTSRYKKGTNWQFMSKKFPICCLSFLDLHILNKYS